MPQCTLYVAFALDDPDMLPGFLGCRHLRIMTKNNTAGGTYGCIKLEAQDAFHIFQFRQTIHSVLHATQTQADVSRESSCQSNQ